MSQATVARPRVKSPFFWGAIIAGASFGIFAAAHVADVLSRDGVALTTGWTAQRTSAQWVVARVSPRTDSGPVLVPGDIVLAIDGDPRAGIVGPDWWLKDSPPGREYRVDVQRGAQRVSVPQRLAMRPIPGERIQIWLALCVALVFMAYAVFLAAVRPDSAAVRFAALNLGLTAAFMLSLATPVELRFVMMPTANLLPVGPVALALGFVYPIYFIPGVLFLDRFPVRVPASRRWKWFLAAVIGSTLLVWALRATLQMLRIAPLASSAPLLSGPFAFLVAYRVAMPTVEPLFAAFVLVANILILNRNARALTHPDHLRRVRMVILGIVVPGVAGAMVGIFSGVVVLVGGGATWLPTLQGLKLAANTLFIVGPATMTYAIIKHRVLGIHVFIRQGLQYLVAQTSLRLAIALPLIALGWRLVSQRDATMEQVLLSRTAVANWAFLGILILLLRFREVITGAVDRRFFREAYDQESILTSLADAVRHLDSVQAIARTVGHEIAAALHARSVRVLFKDPTNGSLSVAYDSAPSVAAASAVDMAGGPDTVHETSEWLQHGGVEPEHRSAPFEVPITGVEGAEFGRLVLGDKLSEEPFTARDKALLTHIATQIGMTCEVIALRQSLGRQQQVEREVLGRLDKEGINLVRECPTCGACYDSVARVCPDDGASLVFAQPIERVLNGEYRLDHVIGRGGMGAVYRAHHLSLDREVALKVIAASALGDHTARRRFAREAQASARLEHPNIVRVYDFGHVGESAFLVMELLAGASWREELERIGPFAPPLAANLLDQALAGVQAAHEAGILHRDLKPENLFIARRTLFDPPCVKVLDFGLAKVTDSGFDDAKSITSSGVGLGTVGYMSPEQCFAGEVAETTDVYSMAVIALETLTGPMEFRRYDYHRASVELLEQRLPLASQDTLRRPLNRVLARAMAFDPSERTPTIASFRAELIPALRDMGIALLAGQDETSPRGGEPKV